MQQSQLTVAGLSGSHPNPNTVRTAQGSTNPNLDAFNQTPAPTALGNQDFFALVQNQHGTSDGYEGFHSNDGTQDIGLNTQIDSATADQGESTTGSTNQTQDQAAIDEERRNKMILRLLFPNQCPPGENQQAYQSSQPAPNPAQQPVEEQQVVDHEQVVQDQSYEGEMAWQASDDDSLFGDSDLELLAPVARYNEEH